MWNIEKYSSVEYHTKINLENSLEKILDIIDAHKAKTGIDIRKMEILHILKDSYFVAGKKFSKNPEYHSPNIVFTILENNKESMILFNLETQKFVENLDEKMKKIDTDLRQAENFSFAMNYIFHENSKEFYKTLNHKDTLKTSIYNEKNLKLEGKNLQEIQLLLREKIAELKVCIESGRVIPQQM